MSQQPHSWFLLRAWIKLKETVYQRPLQLFTPPKPFSSKYEQAFLKDHGARFASQRQSAAVLGLMLWGYFFYWDFVTAKYNPEFNLVLYYALLARTIAAIVIFFAIIVSFRPFFRNDHIASIYMILAAGSCYASILVVMPMLSFPFNFLFFMPTLISIMTFIFGLFRLRSIYTIVTLVLFSAMGSVTFFAMSQSIPLDAGTTGFSRVLLDVAVYYPWLATTALVSFTAIGWSVSVELERSARDAFLRQHELEEAYAKIQQAQVDLQARSAAIVRVKEELQVRAERESLEKSRFLASAAHDLRQPMQAVSTFLELSRQALEKGDYPRAERSIEMTQRGLRLARASFNAVLDVSRLETGFIQAEYSSFDLTTLLQESITQLQGLAEHHGVAIRVRRFQEKSVVVRSDRELLARVFGNLISNSIKYKDINKKHNCFVFVGVVAYPTHARIDVVDNGIGIPRSAWVNIFKPFVQLNNLARDREKGLGLGLSTTNAILKLLKEHRLQMTSTEGRGTRFSIEVPRSEELAVAPRLEIIIDELSLQEAAGLYVLCVEDDTLVRASLSELFDAYGILYEMAGSFEEFGRILGTLERTPDLLITDYRLPDGYTAGDVINLTAKQLEEEIPALVLTGEVAIFEGEPWTSSVKHVLRKPVAPETLLQHIILSVQR